MDNLAMTYAETKAYWLGRSDAVREMQQARAARREREAARKRRAIHFLKQKGCGVAMLAISVLSPLLLEGDATIALIAVPLGLYLICTKEVVLQTSYFYELKESRGRQHLRVLRLLFSCAASGRQLGRWGAVRRACRVLPQLPVACQRQHWRAWRV